ncbi:MAG: metallophosphoesterase, partial [Candidatus Shapirobacteria bacterium]|nr:metallophosphoesterase [Candidatus Shapirobacteria bacterium]
MKKWWPVILIVVLGLGVWWVVSRPKIELLNPGKKVEETVKPFIFVVMADIHNDNKELKKALVKTKDLVIVAGDLTVNGTSKELLEVKKTLDESQVKYLVVPGNHDVIKKQFGSVFGQSYQTFIKDNLKLILIDNSYWSGLDDIQKKWIENESQVCRVMLCVAIMHMPLEHS